MYIGMRVRVWAQVHVCTTKVYSVDKLLISSEFIVAFVYAYRCEWLSKQACFSAILV